MDAGDADFGIAPRLSDQFAEASQNLKSNMRQKVTSARAFALFNTSH